MPAIPRARFVGTAMATDDLTTRVATRNRGHIAMNPAMLIRTMKDRRFFQCPLGSIYLASKSYGKLWLGKGEYGLQQRLPRSICLASI